MIASNGGAWRWCQAQGIVLHKRSCCHFKETLVCSCLLSDAPTTCCKVAPQISIGNWNYLRSTARLVRYPLLVFVCERFSPCSPWNVNLEAPDKFGSTWLAKCQETHEGARRSNKPGRVQWAWSLQLGFLTLGFAKLCEETSSVFREHVHCP